MQPEHAFLLYVASVVLYSYTVLRVKKGTWTGLILTIPIVLGNCIAPFLVRNVIARAHAGFYLFWLATFKLLRYVEGDLKVIHKHNTSGRSH